MSVGAAGQCPIKYDQKCCKIIRIAAYIACHTSINAVDDLSDIWQDEMGNPKMHQKKCMLLSNLVPHFSGKLVEDNMCHALGLSVCVFLPMCSP